MTAGFASANYSAKEPRHWALDFSQESLSDNLLVELPDEDDGNVSIEKNSGGVSEPTPVVHAGDPVRGRQLLTVGSVALVVTLLVSLVAAVAVKQKMHIPKLPTPDMQKPSEQSEVDICIKQFENSVGELNEAWQAASHTVRKAFEHHFSPVGKGLRLKGSDAWEVLKDQRNIFLKSLPEDDCSEEQRRAFVKQAKLITAIFDASSERLRALGRLERISTKHGIPIPLIDMPAGEHWCTYGHPSQGEQPVTFKEFLRLLPQDGQGYIPEDNDDDDDEVFVSVVSMKTAAKLADVIRIEDAQREDDNYIYHFFDRFANTFGLSLVKMTESDAKKAASFVTVGGELPFPSGDFLRFLRTRFKSTSHGYMDPLIFKSLENNWNEQRLNDLIEQIVDDQRRRSQDLGQQKLMTLMSVSEDEDMKENSLFVLALFLL